MTGAQPGPLRLPRNAGQCSFRLLADGLVLKTTQRLFHGRPEKPHCPMPEGDERDFPPPHHLLDVAAGDPQALRQLQFVQIVT